jgi:O-6-methylguanine DNA methyltransferase
MRLLLKKYEAPEFSLLVVTDETGKLRALDYADYESRMNRLLRVHYGEYQLKNGAAPRPITDALDAYFAGEIAAVADVPVETGGTQFQREVWRALRDIPGGQTRTYGNIARAIGSPTASRAVGAANGSNPIAIVVPCHRVIGSNGTLTGYAGGIERKRWLLDHERKFARPAAPTSTRGRSAELAFAQPAFTG